MNRAALTPVTRRLLVIAAVGLVLSPFLLCAGGWALSKAIGWWSPSRPPTQAELAAALRSDQLAAALGNEGCTTEVLVSEVRQPFKGMILLNHTERCGEFTTTTTLRTPRPDQERQDLDKLAFLELLGGATLPVIPDLPFEHSCVASADQTEVTCVILMSGVSGRYQLSGPPSVARVDHLFLRDQLVPLVEARGRLPSPDWPTNE